MDFIDLSIRLETIYLKDNITTIGSYVTSNYTQKTSDKSGYTKYILN